MSEKKYLTEAEVVKRSGLSKGWHQRKRLEGDGPPFIKLDHRIVYDVEKYDQWFEERTKQSTSEYPTHTPVNRRRPA